MGAINESLAWLEGADGVQPEAARDPWTPIGAGAAGTSVDDGGFGVDSSGTGERLLYYRKAFASDRATVTRGGDRIELQLVIEGESYTPSGTWASQASPIGLIIDDGIRRLAVSVGSSLLLIDAEDGDVIATVAAEWSWNAPHVYMLRKLGTESWELWVDGKRLYVLGYGGAPEAGGVLPTASGAYAGASAAYTAWGILDEFSDAAATFNRLEPSLNLDLPPQHKTDRARASMLVGMQGRWNTIAEAALRATVGLVEQGQQLIQGAYNAVTGGQHEEEVAEFSGARLPSAETPPWTLVTPGQWSIQRGRAKVTHVAAATTIARYVFASQTGQSDNPQWILRARIKVDSYTPDGFGRVGPVLRMFDDTRVHVAQLVETVAGAEWAWVLTTNAISGAAVVQRGTPIPVDPFQEHEVAIVVDVGFRARLHVGGRIRDDIEYARSATSSTNPSVEIIGIIGCDCVFTLTDVKAARRVTDQSRRAMFIQLLIERLFLIGGLERNDTLVDWRRHVWGVHELRGTTHGMLLEARRFSNSDACAVVREATPGDWYLELSYPEVTPIFLEFHGDLLDVFLEFPIGALTMGPQGIADWCARYMLPISVLELQYFACLSAMLTGSTTNPTPTTTRCTVTTTEGFEVGDTVTIRTSDNTTYETAQILAIVSDTVLDLDEAVSITYTGGSVVRKTLAAS